MNNQKEQMIKESKGMKDLQQPARVSNRSLINNRIHLTSDAAKKNMKFQLLDEKEVSEWTGISLGTLRNMRSKPGKDPIPYSKCGRSIRYRDDLLVKWVERNTFDSIERRLR